MSNAEQIRQIDKQVSEINAKISRLRNTTDQTKQDNLITRIAQLQNETKDLVGKRTSLLESNKKMYLYGENANNYIFALNRLPNNFQRLTRKATKANETQDLKSISSLSLSSSIADTITEILSENYPAELDRLFDGTFDYKFSAKPKINKWIDTCIEKLYTLGYTVINRGDLVDDIQNQINALLELKNDLTLIKLTRERKIKNYAEVRKIFTEGQRVQEGTSVPKNERATRAKTERVSRPATGEELKDLVKRAREENLGDVFGETTDSELTGTKDWVDSIMNATLDNLEEVYQTAFLGATEEGSPIIPIVNAKKARLKELNMDVSIKNVAKGEYLISINPIFTDQSNEIVLVTKKTKNSVTLKNISTDETMSFTEEQLINNFEKTTMEATQPEPEVEITPTDVETSVESKNTINDLIKNEQEKIAQSQAQAKATDAKSRWNKLGKNSNLC